mgnify:CR=1 FL=1
MVLSSNSYLLKYNEVACCKIKGTYPEINVELNFPYINWNRTVWPDCHKMTISMHSLIKAMLNEPGSFHPPNLTYTLEFPSSLNQWEYSSGVRLICGLIRSLALKMSSVAYIFKTKKRQALLAHDLRTVCSKWMSHEFCHTGLGKSRDISKQKDLIVTTGMVHLTKLRVVNTLPYIHTDLKESSTLGWKFSSFQFVVVKPVGWVIKLMMWSDIWNIWNVN